MPRFTNELAGEQSPYLLQHAHNPVNWKPWGAAAFEQAREYNKPVFLSIGYATCHWCHVMERESFEDEDVAALLNEYFVCIKVDREERPDIDHAYMEVCQAMTGHGGWPLSLVLTPDKAPIFSGTYFPKYSRMGQIGFMDVMRRIAGIWANEHERLKASGENIVAVLKERAAEQAGESGGLTREILDNAAAIFDRTFDEKYGGFDRKPKFPTPHHYILLLRLYHATGQERLQEIAVKSLVAMRRGGMFDHIGFGFHRYSTDERWFLPHFEKMLYDQAMLAIAYTEAYCTTGDVVFRKVVDEIFEYVARDLTSPEGAFYSAEDADSEGEEGKFYVWTWEEIGEVLPQQQADVIRRYFHVDKDGNYREEATGEATGTNIFFESEGENTATADDLNAARVLLLENRSKRPRPLRDDKILTDWNGMMIAALAYAGRLLESFAYIERAKCAADFLLQTMRYDNGLLHRYRNGSAAIEGFLDDYAFLAWGLFELYQATGEITYLTECHALCAEMLICFADKSGGFRFSADGRDDTPFGWQRPSYDSAIPSGNSAAIYVLARMGALCGENRFLEAAYRGLGAFSSQISQYPAGFSWMLATLEFLTGSRSEIVLSGDRNATNYVEMSSLLKRMYLPDAVILYNDGSEEIAKLSPKAAVMHEGVRVAAFVCEQFSCRAAVHSVEELHELLQETRA